MVAPEWRTPGVSDPLHSIYTRTLDHYYLCFVFLKLHSHTFHCCRQNSYFNLSAVPI